MAEITKISVKKKLLLGLNRLKKAGDDQDGLGLALTTIHGALEDYLRLWIANHPHVSQSTRDGALDRGTFSWRDLLAHLDQYGQPETYLQELRGQIPRFNVLRQEVAHGGVFEGSREELMRYAELVARAVEQGIGNISGAAGSARRSGTSRRLHDPIALERLREQKLARLDREWRMDREQFMVRNQHGRPYLPGKWQSLGTAAFAIVFGVVWFSFTSSFPKMHHAPDALDSLFPLAGPVICIGIFLYSMYSYNKAAAYELAEARYRQEREALLADEDL